MRTDFDEVAESYDAVVPRLPAQYIAHLRSSFQLGVGDNILDLGCGSGLLTLQLAEFAGHVTGIDLSQRMIAVARKRDSIASVAWVCGPAELFEFPERHYALIISFEAFHLFANPRRVLARCAAALRPGGYLAIGWANYEWEGSLKEVITRVFRSYGVEWGEWDYQACPLFDTWVRVIPLLSNPRIERVTLPARTSLQRIARYLATIGKTSGMSAEQRGSLVKDLAEEATRVFPSGSSSGQASYFVKYSQRVVG